MKPTANFHEDREPHSLFEPRFVIQAICIDGVVFPCLPEMEEATLLVMIEEYEEWKRRGVELPPLALTYAHQCLHLTFELTKRLAVKRATSLLNRIGEQRYGRRKPR